MPPAAGMGEGENPGTWLKYEVKLDREALRKFMNSQVAQVKMRAVLDDYDVKVYREPRLIVISPKPRLKGNWSVQDDGIVLPHFGRRRFPSLYATPPPIR